MSQWGRQAHSPLNYQVNLIGQLHYTGFSNLVYGIRNLSSNPCFTDKVHFTTPMAKVLDHSIFSSIRAIEMQISVYLSF